MNAPDESYTVAYDPIQQTVIEIWSTDGTMFAHLPSGEVVSQDNAREVLKAVVQSDRVQVRDVPGHPPHSIPSPRTGGSR